MIILHLYYHHKWYEKQTKYVHIWSGVANEAKVFLECNQILLFAKWCIPFSLCCMGKVNCNAQKMTRCDLIYLLNFCQINHKKKITYRK